MVSTEYGGSSKYSNENCVSAGSSLPPTPEHSEGSISSDADQRSGGSLDDVDGGDSAEVTEESESESSDSDFDSFLCSMLAAHLSGFWRVRAAWDADIFVHAWRAWRRLARKRCLRRG